MAHARQIGLHLVRLDQPAKAHHVGDAGHGLELALHHPVLQRAQFGRRKIVGLHAVTVDLTDRGRQRRHVRMDAVGKIDVVQAFGDQLAGKVVAGIVVEGDHLVGQPELGMRKQAYGIRNAGQRHFQRDGDLLFHLLGSAPGKQRDDRDLRIGDVGKGFDRQVLERNQAAADENEQSQDDEQRLAQREPDEALDHA